MLRRVFSALNLARSCNKKRRLEVDVGFAVEHLRMILPVRGSQSRPPVCGQCMGYRVCHIQGGQRGGLGFGRIDRRERSPLNFGSGIHNHRARLGCEVPSDMTWHLAAADEGCSLGLRKCVTLGVNPHGPIQYVDLVNVPTYILHISLRIIGAALLFTYLPLLHPYTTRYRP